MIFIKVARARHGEAGLQSVSKKRKKITAKKMGACRFIDDMYMI